ncbi:MAG: RHS repeat-associated core domain-containing protein [Clostridia bacterium]|nr:RHS repeat-associated core domain-containing protein [Clostridia bacterium]
MLVLDEDDDSIIDGYTHNRVEYNYSRDYTGYPYYNSPENIEADDYVCRVTEERENATFRRRFYKKDDAVLEYEEVATYNNLVGNSLVVTTIVEDYLLKMPIMLKKTYSNGTDYTYDLLYCVVKTMTDNDGNTTYYEYDALGRPTRIIYPEYSTYSTYGTKDIAILPIEDITYESVRYKYSGVTYSDEDLIAQRITDTISYYDVSDVDASNPSALDLTALTRTFYAFKQNYYLGTGELIKSDVLDTVEGSAAINTTKYYYSTSINFVKEEDSKGNMTVTYYDGAGREVKVTDQFDNNHITEYNISGDGVGFKALSYFVPASDTSLKQNVVEFTYDRLGRTTKEKGYSDYPNTSVEVSYNYDFVGNVIGIIDANNTLNEDGYTQTNTYDKLNRVTSSKNANNEIIRNTYDSLGNIKKQTITDSDGTESILYQRSYDGDGKIVSDTDNAGNSNLYVYDNMGRLQVSQDKALKQNSFGYNELGTLDLTSSANPEDSIIARNYAFKNPYGANTVYDVRGTYDEATSSYAAYMNEITQYSYSPTGNLTEQYGTYAIDTGMDDVDFNPYVYYQYDSTGNIVSALHGIVDNVNETIWGATTHYEYNKNRLSKVQIDGEDTRNTADSVNVSYEYYDDGKLKSVTYPALTDGSILKSEYVYDGLSRLTSLTNYKGTEILSGYTYTYDSNGNILTTTETVGTTQNSVTYTYDKLNRIASVAGTKGADSYYEYDARGNRKANFEQIDFLSEESAIFIYNAEDMLDRSQVGSDITYLEYSSNGYRYFKKENSSYPEYYVYDPEGRLQAVTAAATLSMADGSTMNVMFPITHYIWGLDRVLAKIDKTTNKSYYYLYNGHGDVVQIVDTSGTIKNTYDYDVWGNFLKKEETIENHFTYFGQTYDETTGLYYLRARYYDPTTGRFTQQDTAEDGYNWYIYGNQNPVMYVDYTGEGAEGILSGAWGLGAGAASLDGPFPYGDVAGLVIGIVGSAIAGGVAIYEAATSGSNEKSKDDSKDKDSRLTGEPGEIKEERKSKTKIGSDGRAVKERHYSDHGNPSKHTNPHDHDITWDANGNPQFGPPINYPNGAPTFK